MKQCSQSGEKIKRAWTSPVMCRKQIRNKVICKSASSVLDVGGHFRFAFYCVLFKCACVTVWSISKKHLCSIILLVGMKIENLASLLPLD